MEIVDSCALFPGCCAITRSSEGPFVDTGRHGPGDERIYLQVAFVRELAALVGMVQREELQAALDGVRRLHDEIERLEATERNHDLLQEAVRYTLLNGSLVGKDGEKSLRQKPGLERPVMSEVDGTISVATSTKE